MKPLKILVVDDNDKIRNIWKQILERRGYTVTQAQNGQVGLDEFTKNPCDIVITDFNMPAMNGLEMAQKIKQLSGDVKIIMITGSQVEQTPDIDLLCYKSGNSTDVVLEFIQSLS